MLVRNPENSVRIIITIMQTHIARGEGRGGGEGFVLLCLTCLARLETVALLCLR